MKIVKRFLMEVGRVSQTYFQKHKYVKRTSGEWVNKAKKFPEEDWQWVEDSKVKNLPYFMNTIKDGDNVTISINTKEDPESINSLECVHMKEALLAVKIWGKYYQGEGNLTLVNEVTGENLNHLI